MRCVSAVGSCSAFPLLRELKLESAYSVCRRAALAGKWRMCEGVLLTPNAPCDPYKFTVNRGLKPVVVGHTLNACNKAMAEL